MRKRIFNFILLLTLSLVCVLTGCTETSFNANMKIVPSEQVINITLGRVYEEGLPEATKRFSVDIQDADDSTVLMEYGENIKVNFVSGYGTEKVQATVQGLTAGTSRITIYSPDNSDKKAHITVRVFSPIETVSFKENFSCLIEVGGQGAIDVTKDLEIAPKDGNKDDISFEIVGETLGATINEKTGVIDASNASTGSITVKVCVKGSDGVPYTEDTAIVQFVQGIKSSDVTVSNVTTGNPIDLNKGISLVKTMEEFSTNEVRFEINTSQEVEIKVVSYKSTIVSIQDIGNYSFVIGCTSLGSTSITFSLNIKGAGQYVTPVVLHLPVEVIDAPTDLNVNGEAASANPDGFKLNVYNTYDNSMFGTEIRLTLTPSSVLEKDGKIRLQFLRSNGTDGDPYASLIVMDESGNEIDMSGHPEIDAGSSIYVSARPDVIEGNFALKATVVASETYKVNGKIISSEIQLNVKQGATRLYIDRSEFSEDDILYLEYGAEATAITLYAEPDSADISGTKFETSNNNVVVHSATGDSTTFLVEPRNVGTTRITFTTPNGKSDSCNVRVYIPLDRDQTYLDCENPYQNGAIALKEVDEYGSIKKVVVASNRSIKINIITNAGADYYASFVNIPSNQDSFSFSEDGLLSIYRQFEERVATVIIYPTNAESFELTFLVEGFIPLSSLSLSSLNASLKDSETVGYSYVEKLSTLKLDIKAYPQNATVLSDSSKINWSASANYFDKIVSLDGRSITVVAKGLNGAKSLITHVTATITEYSKTYTVSCEVIISEAIRVNSIILNNVINRDIYFDGRQGLAQLDADGNLIADTVDLFYEVDYTVEPAEADNKTIKFEYLSLTGGRDVPLRQRVFTIDRLGRIIPLKSGTAILRLGAEDSYNKEGVPGTRVDIRVTVADGKTRMTALRIFSKSDLISIGTSAETMKLCYMLANDINVGDDGKPWKPIGLEKGLTFTGELTGSFRQIKLFTEGDGQDIPDSNSLDLFTVLYTSKIYGLKFTHQSFVVGSGKDTTYGNCAGLFAAIGRQNTEDVAGIGANYFDGLLTDLTIEASVDVDLNIDVYAGDNMLVAKPTEVNFGAFAGRQISKEESHKAGLVNCEVSYSKFNFRTHSGVYNIGGAVGHSMGYVNTKVSYQSSQVTMNIISETALEKLYVGGIVGYADAKFYVGEAAGTVFRSQIIGDYQGNELTGGDVVYIFGDGETFSDTTMALKIKVLGVMPTVVDTGSSSNLGIGGIAGYLSEFALIKNVSVMSDIEAEGFEYVGGIAGYSKGHIETVYSAAHITGERFVGGVAGYVTGYVSGSNKYKLDITDVEIEILKAFGYITNSEEVSNHIRFAAVENYYHGSASSGYLLTGKREVGGIAGGSDGGNIEYSYVINFIKENGKTVVGVSMEDGLSNAGAIVGLALNTKVVGCSADFGELNFFGSAQDGTTVKDSFSRHSFNLSSNIRTSYIRDYTGKITVYDSTGGINEPTASDFEAAGIVGAFFNYGFTLYSTGVWFMPGDEMLPIPETVNDGYPVIVYNSTLVINIAQEVVTITIKETSNSHIKVEETSRVKTGTESTTKKVILYFYDVDGVKSAAVKQTLMAKNTINLLDVLNIEVSPKLFKHVRLTVKINDVNPSTGTVLNGSVCAVLENGKLRTKSEGLVKITISSAYNPDASDYFYAYIVKRIQSFVIYDTLNHKQGSFQYQGNATLNIRKNTSEYIYPTLTSSDVDYNYSITSLFGVRYSVPLYQGENIIIGNESLQDKEPALNYLRTYINNGNGYAETAASGQLVVTAKDFASANNTIIAEPYYTLRFPVEDGKVDDYRVFFAGTGNVKNKSFKITVYEGAFEILSNVESATYSPSDSVEVELTLVTDIESDSVGYTVTSEYADALDFVRLEKLSAEKVGKLTHVKYKAMISLKFDYESRYFRENREFEFRFYSNLIKETYIDVNITYVPQKLGRIDLQFYSSFDEVSTKPSTNEVRRKTPGLIMIDLYPFYANTDYIEIVSESVNGVYLNFEQVQYQMNDRYYKTVTPSGVIVEEGLGLRLRKVSQADDNRSYFTGKYYVRTQLSAEIEKDMIISFTVNAYTFNKETGEYEKTLSTPLTLLAKESDTVKIEVVDTNGLNYAVKGTTSQIKVTLKGKYSKLAYHGSYELPNSILNASDNDKQIFSDTTLQDIVYTNAKKGTWINDTTVVYYDTIYVGIGIPSGTKIAINVTLNSLEEQVSVRTQATLTVVDFLISDIKLNTSTFNSVTNSANIKVLEYYKLGISSFGFNAAPNYDDAVEKYIQVPLGIDDSYNNYYYGYFSDGRNLISVTNTRGVLGLKVFANYNQESKQGFILTQENITKIESLKLYLNQQNRFFTDIEINNGLAHPYVNLVSRINKIMTANLKEGETTTDSFEHIEGILQKIGDAKGILKNNSSILSVKSGNEFVGVTDTIDYSKYNYTITSKDADLNDYADDKLKETIYYLIGKSVSNKEALRLNIKYYFNDKGEFVFANNLENVYQSIDYIKDYNFKIVSASDFDDPFPIYSAADLMAMTEGESYILMNDITLTDWEPLDVAITSLDGNGFTLKLKSFSYDTVGTGSISLGVFAQVSEDTILKNITLNIHELEVLDLKSYSEITIGLLAATNNGVITNCVIQGYDKRVNSNGFGFKAIVSSVVNGNVVVSGYMNSMYKQYSLEVETSQAIEGAQVVSTVGLLVASNAGSITHSRVGSIVADYTTSTYDTQITVKASGKLGGLAAVNEGQIASSYVSNIYILNSSAVAGESLTAGFVAENSGRISTSYVKGSDNYNRKKSDVNYLRPDSGGIMSNGAIGGFVFNNSGEIYNSYSNIAIESYSSRTAGFVVTNSGSISTCYSASEVGSNSLSHTPFTGYNQYSDIDNTGTIERSYYMVGKTDKYLVKEYGELASAIPASEFGSEASFNGFSFSSSDYEAVWGQISSTDYPELTAANNIAFSQRIRSESGDIITDAFGQVINVSLYEYLSDRLGSSTNPYIIRNAEEYNYYFNSDATLSLEGELVVSEKYFRIVNDIDFDQVAGELATKAMVLNACNIEGNDFTLSNVRVNADKDEAIDSVGLFKKLIAVRDEQDTLSGDSYSGIVKNLTISLAEANAVGVNYVGGLAGIIENNNIFNINIVPGQGNVIIQGKNIVGGLAGYITGNTKVFTINSSVSVQATYKNASQAIPDYFSGDVKEVSELSHAGALAGIIDVSDSNVYAQDEVALIDNANIKFIKVSGNVSVHADYAGGLVGYLGTNTHLLDGRFYVSDEHAQSINSGYAAGGLVGINFGVINHSVIECEPDTQDEIDEEIKKYISTGKYSRRNTTLYQGNPTYMGGIAGINYLGYIHYSYSRVDIYDPNPKDTTDVVEQYVGGLAGRTVAGDFKQSYATSDVLSKNNNYSYAGGLFGRMEAHISQQETGAQINYVYPKFDAVYLFNIYDAANIKDFYARNESKNFGLVAGFSTFDFIKCAVSPEQDSEGGDQSKLPGEVGIYYAEIMEAGGVTIYNIDKTEDETVTEDIIKNFIGSGYPLKFVPSPFPVIKDDQGKDVIKSFKGPNFVTELTTRYKFEEIFSPQLSSTGDFKTPFDQKHWFKEDRFFPRLSLATMSDITIIETAEDFLQIATATGKIFQVANNIDLSGYEFTNYVINKDFSGILRSSYEVNDELVPVTITGIYLYGGNASRSSMGIFRSVRRAQFINVNFEFAAFDSTQTVLKDASGDPVFKDRPVVSGNTTIPRETNVSHVPDATLGTKRDAVDKDLKLTQAGGIAGSDESSLYSNSSVRILNKINFNAQIEEYKKEAKELMSLPKYLRYNNITRIMQLLDNLKIHAPEGNTYYDELISYDTDKMFLTSEDFFDKESYHKIANYLNYVDEDNPMIVNADYVGGFAGFGTGAISVTGGSFFEGNICVDTTRKVLTDTNTVDAYVGSLFGSAKTLRLAGSDYENIGISVTTSTTTNLYVGGIVGSVSTINITSNANDVNNVEGKIDVKFIADINSSLDMLYVGGVAGQIYAGNAYNIEVDVPISISTHNKLTATFAYLGGFAGYTGNFNLFNALINADISNITTANTDTVDIGTLYMGGAIGEFISGNASNIKIVADMTENWIAGTISVGGFAGMVQSFTAVDNIYNITNCFVAGDIDVTLTRNDASVGGLIGNVNCILSTDQEGVISDLIITQVTTSLIINLDVIESDLESQELAIYLGGIVANAFYRDAATTSTTGVVRITQSTSLCKISSMKVRNGRANLAVYAGGVAGYLPENSEIQYTLSATTLVVGGYGKDIDKNGENSGCFIGNFIGRVDGNKIATLKAKHNIICSEVSGVLYVPENENYIEFDLTQDELIAYLHSDFTITAESEDYATKYNSALLLGSTMKDIYDEVSLFYDVTNYWSDILNGYIKFTVDGVDEHGNSYERKKVFLEAGKFVYNPYVLYEDSKEFTAYTIKGFTGNNEMKFLLSTNSFDDSILQTESFFYLKENATLNANFDFEFNGVFNGKYKIINIDSQAFTTTQADSSVGLFNRIGRKGLVTLTAVDLTGTGRSAVGNVGVLTGINNGVILNCYVEGILSSKESIEGDLNTSLINIGGIAGINRGVINSTQSDVEIHFNTVNASSTVGVAVGFNDGGTLYNICCMGNIESEIEGVNVEKEDEYLSSVAAFVGHSKFGSIYKAQVATSVSNFKANVIKKISNGTAYAINFDSDSHIIGATASSSIYQATSVSTSDFVNNRVSSLINSSEGNPVYNYNYEYLTFASKFVKDNKVLLISTGDGLNTPYELINVPRLQIMNSYKGSKFILKYNLDFMDYNGWIPIGGKYFNERNVVTDNAFTGTFEGNNKYINSFYVSIQDRDKETTLCDNYLGFFGYTKNAKICENSSFTLRYDENTLLYGIASSHGIDRTYYSHVGSFIGRADSTLVNNVTVEPHSGSIYIYAYYAGGLIGYTYGSQVKNCRVDNVKVYSEHGYGYYYDTENPDRYYHNQDFWWLLGSYTQKPGSRFIEYLEDLEAVGLPDLKDKYFLKISSDNYGYYGDSGKYAGGLIAYARQTNITNCHANAEVNAGQGGDGSQGSRYLRTVYTYYWTGSWNWIYDYQWCPYYSAGSINEKIYFGDTGGSGGAAGKAGGLVGYLGYSSVITGGCTAEGIVNGGNGGYGGVGGRGQAGSDGVQDGKNTLGHNGADGGNGGKGGKAGGYYGPIYGQKYNSSVSTDTASISDCTRAVYTGRGGNGGNGGAGGSGSYYTKWHWLWPTFHGGSNGHPGYGGYGGKNGEDSYGASEDTYDDVVPENHDDTYCYNNMTASHGVNWGGTAGGSGGVGGSADQVSPNQ